MPRSTLSQAQTACSHRASLIPKQQYTVCCAVDLHVALSRSIVSCVHTSPADVLFTFPMSAQLCLNILSGLGVGLLVFQAGCRSSTRKLEIMTSRGVVENCYLCFLRSLCLSKCYILDQTYYVWVCTTPVVFHRHWNRWPRITLNSHSVLNLF